MDVMSRWPLAIVLAASACDGDGFSCADAVQCASDCLSAHPVVGEEASNYEEFDALQIRTHCLTACGDELPEPPLAGQDQVTIDAWTHELAACLNSAE